MAFAVRQEIGADVLPMADLEPRSPDALRGGSSFEIIGDSLREIRSSARVLPNEDCVSSASHLRLCQRLPPNERLAALHELLIPSGQTRSMAIEWLVATRDA